MSERRAMLSPDTTGLVDADTGEAYTYRQLDARANRTARLLRASGVERGDRVAAVARNRPELVDLYFATAKLGAILAPLSHRLAPPEIAELIVGTDPSVLFVEQPFVSDVRSAVGDTGGGSDLSVIRFSTAEVTDEPDDTAGTDWKRLAAVLPKDDSPVDSPDLGLSDPHLLLHTGGSTGRPKQVVQSHGGIMWNAFNTISSWGLRDDDVTPMVFPMFHTGGWNVSTIPLFHLGGTVVISREVDPGQILRTIEAHACTLFVGVPAILRFMVEHEAWEEADLASLRFAKSGGAPCRDTVIEAWSRRGVDLSQGYGLTECGPNNFAMPDDFDRDKTGSIGKPAMYVDARIVGEDGGELDRGEIGELELASPHAGERYWDNPEASEAVFDEGRSAFDGAVRDAGSWVSTGDLARVDEEGYYYIEGRKKNMFVSGGENVYPPEVEDVAADHPKVDEVVVIPVPDETWGEVGKAIVEGDESLTLEKLQDFMEGRLAPFKLPKHLTFVESMPMSGPSKIDRQALETTFGAETSRET